VQDLREAAATAAAAISSAAAAAAAGASDISRVGGVFDRAEAAVAAGDLAGALEALAPLRTGGEALEAWQRAARARRPADRALRLLRARASVLAASLY
jgi:hypothetical protein